MPNTTPAAQRRRQPARQSTAARARQVVVLALALLALLPPLLWLGVCMLADRGSMEAGAAPLIAETVWIGLTSCLLALLCWTFVFNRQLDALDRAERRMRSYTSLDPLTGLLNREGLRKRVRRALDRAQAGSGRVGLLLIDLDRFSLINDSLGQVAGDQLLRGAAERIGRVAGRGSHVARLGADQFVVMVEGLAGDAAMAALARNLLRAFETRFSLNTREVIATLSVGGALADCKAGAVDMLLQRAGVALRQAQLEGGNRFRLYQPDMESGIEQRMDLEQRLRAAQAGGQFLVVFQPIVDSRTHSVLAQEALLRWNDPQRGLVSPAEFIPTLEQTGLIVPVGRWVMAQACRQAALWARDGDSDCVVSVNLSPRQFGEPDFLDTVHAVLRETGLPADRLQLEFTEGLLLEPTDETLQRIEHLAAAGVQLAVDDFGMGYSSLAYLKRFRLHTLKIDRLFVCDIVQAQQDRAIVRAIIDLGHGLGLQVTAEGVETAEQAALLTEMGCDALQGHLFGQPASLADHRTASFAHPAPQAPCTRAAVVID
jgi:diguanylate cyclase (GGDEF)-like protein